MKPLFLLLLSCLLLSCQQEQGKSGLLKSILRDRQLIVVTRNAPTTYYELHDNFIGPEYDLTQAFARHLDVQVTYIVKDSVSEMLSALENGEAHLAAAGLTRTADRERRFRFGPIYQEVQQQVVCRRDGKRPGSVADLVNVSLRVPSDTSYDEHLQILRTANQGLQWQVAAEDDTESLLEQVWLNKLDCTVADSNIVAVNRRYLPELSVRFNLTEPQALSWLLPKDAAALQAAIADWQQEFQQSGQLEDLLERYYGFIDEFDYVDTRKFTNRIKTVLPKYRRYFEAAAKKHDLDWLLLAAQSYQESHWRAAAVSPTGVRGIMMLTQETAREVGISSRMNPQQSIYGGALYFRRLYDRIPEQVNHPDRNWYTLAAYNVGMGHLNDARELAQRLGKNPDRWSDLVEVLPLLSKKQVYKTLKHGYARGSEPVRYVQRIRDYHDILHQTLASKEKS